MKLKPTKGRRWRVSVYPPGVTHNLPTDFPLIHKASRKQEIAQAHFDHFAARIGNGEIGRVIMHQGKLYMGKSQYIHNDTRWWQTNITTNALEEMIRRKPMKYRQTQSGEKGERITS